MKKQLLIVALLLSSKAFSQNFTQSNEAAVGTSVSMYVCDSLTSDYASSKGSNVVWDFTTLSIPDTVIRSLISVVDPTTTKYKSLYTTANKAIVFENFLTSYYSSTSNERSCVGYFFNSADLGDVRAVFNTNPEITHTYPFGLSSVKNDLLTGTLYYTYSSYPVTATATGSSTAEVDGLGTIKIDAATSFKNVLRYHIKDSVNATVTLPVLGTVNATLKRDQYEYYDHSVSNLPIYTHSNLKAYVYKISSDPLVDKTTVLSKYKGDKNAKAPVDPNPTTSISENFATSFAVFPNPAKDILYVIGENTLNSTISILDQAGKVVKHFSNTNSLSIQDLDNGVYFIQIESNNKNETLKFIKE
jgi:hypothetical protein